MTTSLCATVVRVLYDGRGRIGTSDPRASHRVSSLPPWEVTKFTGQESLRRYLGALMT